MDRNDRSNLPGYDDLIARGNYHAFVGGLDHIDADTNCKSEETILSLGDIPTLASGPLGRSKISKSLERTNLFHLSDKFKGCTISQSGEGTSFSHLTEQFKRNIKYFDGDDNLETNMHNLLYAGQDEFLLLCLKDLMSYTMLDTINNKKETILHIAVILNKPEMCRKIMIHGADVNKQDKYGDTPLHIACRKGYMDCVQTLTRPLEWQEVKTLSYNIPMYPIPQSSEIRNCKGQTCLHLAVKNRHYDIIYHLVHNLQHNVNLREGKRGYTPFLECIERNDGQMLMYLAIRSINLNVGSVVYQSLVSVILVVAVIQQQ